MKPLPFRAPLLVGAVGGSGTRVVVRLLRQSGMYAGARLSEALDSEPLMRFYDAWLTEYLQPEGFAAPVREAAERDFQRAIEAHREGLRGQKAPWAIKVPKSLLALPLWREAFPELRFVHVLRSGLDLAYSANQHQVQVYGDTLLPEADRKLAPRQRSIAYWRTANLKADADAQALGIATLRLRFEDMCADHKGEAERLLAFAERPDPGARASNVELARPLGIGRWRRHSPREVRSLLEIGKPALERFGYWNEAVWLEAERAAREPLLLRLLRSRNWAVRLPAH